MDLLGIHDIRRGSAIRVPGGTSVRAQDGLLASHYHQVKVFWRWAFEHGSNPPGVVEVMKGSLEAVSERARRRIVLDYTDVDEVVIVDVRED